MRRSSSGKNVDAGGGFSATYTSLLTWLLSLVPDSFDFLQRQQSSADVNAPPTVPFVVLGLQQLYLDGQLALYVAVKATEKFDEKSLPEDLRKSKV